MKLLVAADAHFYVLPDKTYWCDSVENYDFWKRYLYVFDTIRVAVRVKHVESVDKRFTRADGPNMEIWEIPFFQGPKQLAKKYFLISSSFKGCYKDCDCALFRVPSQTAFMAYQKMPKSMPCAGEVVYCQRDSVVGMRFGIIKILHSILSHKLKKFCIKANGVSYVTKNAIQKYYPSHAHKYGETDRYFTTYYSSISLDESYFLSPRSFRKKTSLSLCISDAAMNGERKGERVVIKVVHELRKSGFDVSAIIIGDGSKRKEFEDLAKELDVCEYISFVGQQSTAKEVRNYLIQSDVYILPTQGEGLPRGILEAMALGMPVLSTSVGGIPEVIDNKYLFDPTDVQGFSSMIKHLMNYREELDEMSANNFAKSLEFKNSILQQKRNVFYSKLATISKNKKSY